MADKLTSQEINWIAGLLEGEGCFQTRGENHNPYIQLVMTDSDVVIKAAKILGCHKVIEGKPTTKVGKKIYRTCVYGRRAMGWMMTIYSLMGERRQQKIEECLKQWKNKNTRSYAERRPYSRGAKVVWEDGRHCG